MSYVFYVRWVTSISEKSESLKSSSTVLLIVVRADLDDTNNNNNNIYIRYKI